MNPAPITPSFRRKRESSDFSTLPPGRAKGGLWAPLSRGDDLAGWRHFLGRSNTAQRLGGGRIRRSRPQDSLRWRLPEWCGTLRNDRGCHPHPHDPQRRHPG